MIKRSYLCAALILVLAGTSPVPAQVQARHAIEVHAQDLGTALKLLAQQVKLQIVYSADLVEGKRAPALSGPLTTTQALEQLLQGSGLKYEFLDAQTVTLSPVAEAEGQHPAAVSGQASALDALSEDAQGHGSTPASAASGASSQSSSSGSISRTQDLASITVTGTRIRGGSTPSPTTTIGSERILEEGFNDLGEVIRAVPQNFNGGQNPGSGSGNIAGAGDAQQNMTGGSGLNLRGLGADATLTLLNGRRMAYGGFIQSVDISAIPVAAVDRLEIVSDGASAIYGSDAVGGVANVILKRDFDGLMLGARYGHATDGGLATREYSATGGTTWSSGGLIATYRNASTDPIYTEQRRYTQLLMDPSTLFPGSDLRSGLLSAYQALGERVELRLDTLRTRRDQLQYYNWNNVGSRVTPQTTTTLVAPSIQFLLPGDWTLDIGGSWGKDEHHQYRVQTVLATGVSSVASNDCYCNEVLSYEANAEGPLFALAGGDARIAVGVGQRRNEFQWRNYRTNTNTAMGEESSSFAYAELNLPFVGPEQSIAGVHRLALTGAVRREDYDSFGQVATPKLGLIYGPSSDITLKASWGRSFKAPTLFQQHWVESLYLYPATTLGGTGYLTGATVLVRHGGNSNLEPERARTWSASLAVHPEELPGLEAELTVFKIDFTDRVLQAISGGGLLQALSNPIHAEFVEFAPASGEVAEEIDSALNFSNFSGAPVDISNVVAIIEGRNINVARQEIRGVDLSAAYRFTVGDGRLTLRGAASWLDSTRQNSAAQSQPPYDLAGTLFNPPRVSSRMGGVFSRGGFSASVFGNYKDGVTNLVDQQKTSSFVTFDATLRYAGREESGLWAGIELALSVDNVLDREPPRNVVSAPIYVPAFDQTNYSAIGRFLSLSLSKRW
ncbi:TonB-dependent receptor domain-containing protein [Luteimonas sp. RIT-PG2_3]